MDDTMQTLMPYLLIAGLVYFVIMNVAAYIYYSRDKGLARVARRRVPEKVLLSLGFLGGAAGSLLAMQIVRHKTKHWYFWAVNIAGLIWQLIVGILLVIKLAGIWMG